jgi:hypothetical protein
MRQAKEGFEEVLLVLNQGSGVDLRFLILQLQCSRWHHFMILRGHALIIEFVRKDEL